MILEEYPLRSPLIVAEVLIPIITDKVVYDAGCGAGDLLELWKPYAKSVRGMDNDEHRVALGISQGRDITYADFRKTPIPEAEVYYLWHLPWVLDDIVLPQIKSGIIILGDYDDSHQLENDYGGHTIRVPFDEGQPGWFRLTLFKK